MLQCKDQTGCVELRLRLCEALFTGEVEVELAPWTVLHDEVQLLAVVEGVLQSDNEGMLDLRQHVSLRPYMFQLRLRLQSLLFHHLHREDLLRLSMSH